MSADGIAERRATIARIKTIPNLIVWSGSAPDEWKPPRTPDGKVIPYVVVDFGAPIRTTRDRSIAYGEKGQPHLLVGNIACISGVQEWSEDLMAQVFDLVIDWRPSDTADPFEAQGGYGSRRAATDHTPSQFIEGLFVQTAVNQGLHGLS